MLKIICNNIELDLGELEGISYQDNPGIFELDSFEGSYCIPFSIPDCQRNHAAFAFQGKINAVNKEIMSYPGEIWHSGIQIKTGIIKGTIFIKGEIQCNFYQDNGEMISVLNKKKLTENNLGGYKAFTNKSSWNPDTDDYVIFPVLNPDYWTDTINNGVVPNIQNYYNQNGLIFMQPNPAEGNWTITPFPVLWKVIQYIFKNTGFNYTDSFFTQENYRKICIFNTVNAIENIANIVEGKTYFNKTLTRVDIARHLPEMTTTDFIKAIQNFANVVFYAKNGSVIVVDRKAMIESNNYDELSSKIINYIKKTLTGTSLPGLAFNIQRDENDSNVSELYDISQDTDIEEVNDDPAYVITNPKQNQVVMWKGGYALYEKYISNKTFWPDDPDYWYWYVHPYAYSTSIKHRNYASQMGLFLGSRSFEINCNLSSLPELFFAEDSPGGYDNYFPRLKQVGNSSEHAKKTPFSLRLMIYRGIQSDVEGMTVPHGSYKDGNNGMQITAYWSYYNRWEKFVNWYKEAAKEEFEAEMQLTASEIKNFDYSRKKLINGNLFFVTNISVTLKRNSIEPVKCNLMKA